MPKDFGFGVHCGLWIFRFLASGFQFSYKIIAVFRFYHPIFQYGLYSVFGVARFFLAVLRLLDDFFFGFAGSNIPKYTPQLSKYTIINYKPLQ